MGFIRVLSELVVNKIAAGEVVERPASVVKELLDNALDAGAVSVSVAVSHGGKSLMRVSDDGCGMDEDDARACLVRHATSKISSLEDIESIATMGFRGEALASIAAVSRLTITTRCPESDTAVIVQAAGGEVARISQGVHAPGTTIEVEDLFFNTPARRRFLKSDQAEYGAIAEMFSTLALARPDIGFVLHRGETVAADYPACKSQRKRMVQVLGGEFVDHVHDFALESEGFTAQGFLGAPDFTRVNRTGQKIFINGRPVFSPVINNALSRAYDEFLPARRFPVAVLFLQIAPECVDVNVHPAKREVRIRNERAFVDRLTGAMRASLRARGFFMQPDAEPRLETPAVLRAAEPRASFSAGRTDEGSWRAPFESRCVDTALFDDRRDIARGHAPAPQEMLAADNGPGLPFGMTRILGQLHACFLVAEAGDGLFLVDQHAAHERVVYEELLAGRPRGTAPVQQLLFPAILHLGEQGAAVLQEHSGHLEAMGFGLNDLGAGSFSIDAVPACLIDCDAAGLLTDCVHELCERGRQQSFDTHEQELAAALACKTRTVKAGRTLDAAEQEHLVRRLAACANPHTCPHGRPTFIRISRAEIEKRFMRT